VQREGESTHHWARRVAAIIHSSDSIGAAQAVLLLEQKCHFDPLKQKLGRLKHKCTYMGKLMDVLTRYGDSDTTKDPSSDDDKTSKGKKNDSGKGQQQQPQLSRAIRITKALEGSINILTAGQISWLTPTSGQRINVVIAMASRHRVLRKCLMALVQSIVTLISHLFTPRRTVIS
jgi:hypothetical protein